MDKKEIIAKLRSFVNELNDCEWSAQDIPTQPINEAERLSTLLAESIAKVFESIEELAEELNSECEDNG